jgi:hypothetical protein
MDVITPAIWLMPASGELGWSIEIDDDSRLWREEREEIMDAVSN